MENERILTDRDLTLPLDPPLHIPVQKLMMLTLRVGVAEFLLFSYESLQNGISGYLVPMTQ